MQDAGRKIKDTAEDLEIANKAKQAGNKIYNELEKVVVKEAGDFAKKKVHDVLNKKQ